MKRLLITTVSLVIACRIAAQAPNLDSVKTELYKVNKVFDSSIYLGFNVDIIYSSDTLYGKYEHEEMTGNYILNNKNIFYKMGSTEYMQNDSFAYNVYGEDKMMIMTRNFVDANSTLFPLKDFVDSIITWYDSAYTITFRNDSDAKVIEFTANRDSLPYQHFAVAYDSTSHYPIKFEMSFIQELTDYPDMPDSILSAIKQRPVKKSITILFSDYYNVETLDVFKDENYVYFDRMRKKYKPSEKFRSYRFVADGINGEDDYDPTIEAPPDGN
ncbi:MAG: hypothetical protein Q8941_06690 [Bacteroidota bacterium]|nr:hypothetical protein [Bacteroidota bacterium]